MELKLGLQRTKMLIKFTQLKEEKFRWDIPDKEKLRMKISG
jgi:hypothetical protein